MNPTYNPMENAYRTDPHHAHQGRKMAQLLPFYYEDDALNVTDAHKIVAVLDEPLCCCLEYAGDNPRCPIHGNFEWTCQYCGAKLPSTEPYCPCQQTGPAWDAATFAAGEDKRSEYERMFDEDFRTGPTSDYMDLKQTQQTI